MKRPLLNSIRSSYSILRCVHGPAKSLALAIKINVKRKFA